MPWRSLRSPPAQNAFSPRPVTTMQRSPWWSTWNVSNSPVRSSHLRVHGIGGLRAVERDDEEMIVLPLERHRLELSPHRALP
jgi:hypothetical protein